MTTPAQEPIDVLSRALDQTADVLQAIPADKLSAGTPCNDWDVAGLIAHVVAAPGRFVTMSTGGQPDWSATPPIPADWTAEFRSGADDLLRMWREADESASPRGCGLADGRARGPYLGPGACDRAVDRPRPAGRAGGPRLHECCPDAGESG